MTQHHLCLYRVIKLQCTVSRNTIVTGFMAFKENKDSVLEHV